MKINQLLTAPILVILCIITSCSTDESTNITEVENSSLPLIVTPSTSPQHLFIDGKKYTFRFSSIKQTRAINSFYSRDPNATLATKPRLVQKGKAHKYLSDHDIANSPFPALAGRGMVIIRFDRYEFECNAPAKTLQTSFDITNITPEGFAEESPKYRGFSIDKILSTDRGVTVKCSFYIQNGAAYDLAGRQLTANKQYPLKGEDVQYQFTYQTKRR